MLARLARPLRRSPPRSARTVSASAVSSWWWSEPASTAAPPTILLLGSPALRATCAPVALADDSDGDSAWRDPEAFASNVAALRAALKSEGEGAAAIAAPQVCVLAPRF